MYIKKSDLVRDYKNNMLIPMDIGISLSLLSIKESNFCLDAEIEVIQEFLDEFFTNQKDKENFIEEVYEYYCK